MDIKNYITKLQNLPDKQKKIVLWAVVAVLAIIMGFFWIKSVGDKLNKLSENANQIKLPQIELPNIKMQTDQTAGWKTYTNAELGFEIKYPKNWYSKEIEQGIVEGGFYFSPEKPDESETGGMAFTNEALSMNINSVSPQKSLLEFIENYLNLSDVAKYETEKVKMGDLNGLKVITVCEGVGCRNPDWFIQKDEKIYVFSSNLSDEIDVFEQMISTFKFTK